MSYSDQTPPSPSRTSGSSSGAQYATAALGVGLIALGIVMIMWSVVPAGSGGNSSTPGMDQGRARETSSVAFVLVGGGVALLLLSVCLSVQNKQQAARGQEAGSTHCDEVCTTALNSILLLWTGRVTISSTAEAVVCKGGDP